MLRDGVAHGGAPPMVNFSSLLDNSSDDGDADVDDFFAGPGKKPLLADDYGAGDEDLAEEEDVALPLVDAQRGRGWRRLLGKGRRKRGDCPLCGEQVRSGGHVCQRAEGRLQAGLQADSERNAGNCHFRAGDYVAAASAYRKALEATPEEAMLWSNLAATHTALGEMEAALASSELAIRFAPQWPKGYYRKAAVLEARGDWTAAMEVYAKVRRDAIGGPGEQAKAAQRLATARAQKVVREFPESFSDASLRVRGQQLRAAGAEQLVADGNEARRRMDAAEAAKALGNASVAERQWASARESYADGLATLLSFCPEAGFCEAQARLEAALRLNKALCEGRLGEHRAAAEECTKVLALEPINAKARYRRALALSELHEFDAALEDALTAVALLPRDAEVRALKRRLQHKRRARLQKQHATFARLFEDGDNAAALH